MLATLPLKPQHSTAQIIQRALRREHADARSIARKIKLRASAAIRTRESHIHRAEGTPRAALRSSLAGGGDRVGRPGAERAHAPSRERLPRSPRCAAQSPPDRRPRHSPSWHCCKQKSTGEIIGTARNGSDPLRDHAASATLGDGQSRARARSNSPTTASSESPLREKMRSPSNASIGSPTSAAHNPLPPPSHICP